MIAVAAGTLFALAACSGGAGADVDATAGTEAPAEQEPVTLTVQQSAEWGDMMEILVTRFEQEHPNVTVELQTITPEQKATTNSQIISSANPPDIAQASGDWRQLAANGDLASLDDIYEEIAPRLAEGTAEQLQFDGVFYGIPTGQAYELAGATEEFGV